MRCRRRQHDADNLNLTPLIDVLFVLLIFFMVTTTFVKDMKVDIERPAAASATTSDSKTIRVYIDSSNEVYVDNQPIKLWALQAKLRDMLRTSAEKSILVVSDSKIPVNSLIDVVDECRMSGAKEVAVSTTKELG